MGDSTCVMHAFSYASPIPNEAKQGNPMHALGESISFGRYMSESLAWEKWSTFSNKRYVEEAASYAQPGSVAEKKAFFEAHYKRIAARKAAAAAALLEQQAKAEAEGSASATLDAREHSIAQQVEVMVDNGDETKAATESETSGTPQMEKPLLKKSSSSRKQDVSSVTSKKRTSFSSTKSSTNYHKMSKVPSSPTKSKTPGNSRKAKNVNPITKKPISGSMNENKLPPKSLHTLINRPSTKELDKPPAAAKQKIGSSKVAFTAIEAFRYCSTPLRTPLQATPSRGSKQPSTTPRSEKRRTNTLIEPSGSKSTGPKWQILSSLSRSLTACRNKLQSPTTSTPFLLRTEERAARRKQKLEEKFNAKEDEKVQLQTKLKEKAETELRKLRQSFCFKARPLPHFYKQKDTTISQLNKTPLGRKPSGSKIQGTVSSKKNDGSAIYKANVNGHENTSPNIQH